MSQKKKVTFTCANCEAQNEAEIFRTIWGEVPANRDLVFSNEINRVTCKRCNFRSLVGGSLMYTHAKLYFAVWFEPEYDPQIDAELLKYAEVMKMKGPAYSYLNTPPRIRDWQAFKELILRYENGELMTVSRKFREGKATQQKAQPDRGCLGVLAVTAVIVIAVFKTILS